MQSLINRFKSDDALMQAYQRGDTAAFESLYLRHKDGLFAFLYRSCPRPAIAEELAQEAWTGVINAAPDYRARGHFKTWLYQIGHNRLADFWRRRDNQHIDLDSVPEPADATAPEADNELAVHLMTLIGQLPGDQRDALLLREQGFSVAEIAAITRCGEETAKSRLRYARQQLRAQMGDTP